MPPAPGKLLVLSSILDRLFDDAPQSAQEPPFDARFDLNLHKQAVARDLESLLNARSMALDEDLLVRFPLAGASVLAYGIPDLSSLSLLNPDHRRLLQERILRAIQRFEPRLTQANVDLDLPREANRMLRFRVEGLLRIHPNRPAVVFDAVLQLSSNACQVRSQA
jgi:type VI secretion system protein ImpF